MLYILKKYKERWGLIRHSESAKVEDNTREEALTVGGGKNAEWSNPNRPKKIHPDSSRKKKQEDVVGFRK